MVTTVTLPVYNRSLDASNQTILGVMGVDVTTRTLMEHTPKRKLTPNGYSFAINQNGYIIFHPDLKAQNGWLQDPPNVDFLDLEFETDQKEQVRKKMILGDSGENKTESFYVESDNKHIIEVNRTYTFTSIDNSDFSLCIVSPMYGEVYPVFKTPMDMAEGFGYLTSDNSALLIPKWDYYKNYTRENDSLVNGTTQDLVNEYEKQQQSQWDEELLQHLFWDAKVTQNLGTFADLTKNVFKDICDWKCVSAVFIGTNGGLTRIFPPCPEGTCGNHSAVDEFMNDRDTWKAAYYKRALDTDNLLFMASPRSDDEQKENLNETIIPEVTMVKSVSIRVQNEIYKPAVIGIKMEHSLLLDYMMNATAQSGRDCNDTENLVCYLLDDGAFVISTNQEDQYEKVGMFLGEVDNDLMFALSESGEEASGRFYKSEVRYDYQASCPDQEERPSMAGLRALRIPSLTILYEMLSVNWWSSQLTWAYVNFNLFSWFTSSQSAYGQQQEVTYTTVTDGGENEDEEESATNCSPSESEQKRNHSCTKVEAQYYYSPVKIKGGGTRYCKNCTRVYSAARLQNSNLLLVVSDPFCDECEYHDIKQAPKEVEDPNECTLNLRFRRRPDGCYSRDDREDDTLCGGVVHVPSRVWILVATTITLIVSLSCTSLFT